MGLTKKIRGNEGQVGKTLVKLWRDKYNKTKDDKPQRSTTYKGPCKENAYYDNDRDIIECAITQYCGKVKK